MIVILLDDRRVGHIANVDGLANPDGWWHAFDVDGDHVGIFKGRRAAALAAAGVVETPETAETPEAAETADATTERRAA